MGLMQIGNREVDMKGARLTCLGFSASQINDLPILRYISFGNLVDIFQNKRLTLTPAFEFEDTLEGCISSTQARREISRLFSIEKEENCSLEYSVRAFSCRKRNTYISSWRRNAKESREMWERYAPANDGVAICSTTAILADIVEGNRFDGVKWNYHWGLVPVEYVELTDDFPVINFNNMFDFKMKKFVFEDELRLVADDHKGFGAETKITTAHLFENSNALAYQNLPRKERISLRVDPSEFVQKIVISPGSNKEFSEKVMDLVSRYHFKNAVVSSSLL